MEDNTQESGMTLKGLKNFLNSLPEEFDNYLLVNGEIAGMGPYYVRVDNPIVHVEVDENTKEVIFLHQSQQELEEILTKIDEAVEKDGTAEGTN
jgi:hypothetical protein